MVCRVSSAAFAPSREGSDEAERLRTHGVAAFILKHRLMDTGATEAEFHEAVSTMPPAGRTTPRRCTAQF
jgi:hypothetical protein